MTRPSTTAPVRFEDLDGAIAALRAQGLRLSTARRLVLGALFAAEEPRTAEGLARELDLDAASVYRNLDTLERHGLVRHMHLGHGPGLYVLAGHGAREYLHCDACGTVLAVEPERLAAVREELRSSLGWEARFGHFAIVGRCPRCAGRDDRGEPAVSG